MCQLEHIDIYLSSLKKDEIISFGAKLPKIAYCSSAKQF